MSEEGDELRIDALDDVAVRTHEIGAVREEELRISAQVVRALGERALDADRLHHAVHLPVDALHLREAGLVYLIRRAIRCGFDPHVVRIPRSSIGKRAQSDGFPGAWEI